MYYQDMSWNPLDQIQYFGGTVYAAESEEEQFCRSAEIACSQPHDRAGTTESTAINAPALMEHHERIGRCRDLFCDG